MMSSSEYKQVSELEFNPELFQEYQARYKQMMDSCRMSRVEKESLSTEEIKNRTAKAESILRDFERDSKENATARYFVLKYHRDCHLSPNVTKIKIKANVAHWESELQNDLKKDIIDPFRLLCFGTVKLYASSKPIYSATVSSLFIAYLLQNNPETALSQEIFEQLAKHTLIDAGPSRDRLGLYMALIIKQGLAPITVDQIYSNIFWNFLGEFIKSRDIRLVLLEKINQLIMSYNRRFESNSLSMSTLSLFNKSSSEVVELDQEAIQIQKLEDEIKKMESSLDVMKQTVQEMKDAYVRKQKLSPPVPTPKG